MNSVASVMDKNSYDLYLDTQFLPPKILRKV